jgi:hypothetical protein
VLLVVVVDGLDGLDAGVLLGGVVALVSGLVPVEDAADEGGDQERAGLGGGDGLDQGEEEGQVAVDAVLGLQDVRGLDTLPGGGDLDQDTVLGDTVVGVQLGKKKKSESVLKIIAGNSRQVVFQPYLDDGEGLVDGALGVKGQLGVDLGGDLAGNDLEDLLAELNEETVQGGIDLLVDGAALGLTVGNGRVNESCVLGLLGSSQDQGGVGGGILGLVLADSCVNVSKRI